MSTWLPHNKKLDRLAAKHKTDKGAQNVVKNSPKAYTKYYTEYFEAAKNEPLNLLEIGVYSGASLRMWKEYFPKANIYGIDIRPACKTKGGERIRIFIGDQGDKAFCRKVAKKIGPLHIVVDDGGHRSNLQIASFEALFPCVVSGGIYVIEDLYATSGTTDVGSTHEYFKKEVDRLMRHKIDQQGPIESISFHRPLTSGALMFIRKR